MWKKALTKYVSKVPCSNFLLQTTKFTFPSSSVLIINAYFPCDPQVDEFNDSELLAVLADTQTLFRESQCSDILLAGDLNCHFARQTKFTNLVKDSFSERGLIVMWQNPVLKTNLFCEADQINDPLLFKFTLYVWVYNQKCGLLKSTLFSSLTLLRSVRLLRVALLYTCLNLTPSHNSYWF